MEEEGAVVLMQNLEVNTVSFRYFRPARKDLHKGAKEHGKIKQTYTSEVIGKEQVKGLRAYVKDVMEKKRREGELRDKKAAEIKKLEPLHIAETVIDFYEKKMESAHMQGFFTVSIEVTPSRLYNLPSMLKEKAELLSPDLNEKLDAVPPYYVATYAEKNERALVRYLKVALRPDQLKGFTQAVKAKVQRAYDMVSIAEGKKSKDR